MLIADDSLPARRAVAEEDYAGQRLRRIPTPTTGPAVHLKNVALAKRSGDTCGFISDPSFKGLNVFLHGNPTHFNEASLKFRRFACAVYM